MLPLSFFALEKCSNTFLILHLINQSLFLKILKQSVVIWNFNFLCCCSLRWWLRELFRFHNSLWLWWLWDNSSRFEYTQLFFRQIYVFSICTSPWTIWNIMIKWICPHPQFDMTIYHFISFWSFFQKCLLKIAILIYASAIYGIFRYAYEVLCHNIIFLFTYKKDFFEGFAN